MADSDLLEACGLYAMAYDPVAGRIPAGVKLQARPRVAEALLEMETTVAKELARRREAEARRASARSRIVRR